MVGVVDAGDDGPGDVIGGRRIVVAEGVDRFAVFVVDEEYFWHFIGEFGLVVSVPAGVSGWRRM